MKECKICSPLGHCEKAGLLSRKAILSDGFTEVIFEPIEACKVVKSFKQDVKERPIFNAFERER